MKRAHTTKILFLSILAMLGLSGCGVPTLDHKLASSTFQEGNKAIVIATAKAKFPMFFVSSDHNAQYSFAKVNENYEDKKTRERYRAKSAYADYDIYMIDPGFYVVEDISYGGNPVYTSSVNGYFPEAKKVVYASFSVKPNDVIYPIHFKVRTVANAEHENYL